MPTGISIITIGADAGPLIRKIEEDAARIGVELKCPHPYLSIESLAGRNIGKIEPWTSVEDEPGPFPGDMVSATSNAPRIDGTDFETPDGTASS